MNKKFAILYIIILVILIGAVFTLQLTRNHAENGGSIPITTKNNPPEMIPSLKEYKNQDLKFSIGIPEDWVITESKYLNQTITFNSPKNEETTRQIESGEVWGEGYGEDIQIRKYNTLRDLVAEQFLHDETIDKKAITTIPRLLDAMDSYAHDASGKNYGYKEMQINNQRAYSTILGGFGNYPTYYIEGKNNSIYVISIQETFQYDYPKTTESIVKSFNTF